MTTLDAVDVAIVGGGPAGATAASILARHGYSVAVLTRPHPHRPLAESLPPSCVRLFDRVGLASSIDAGNFLSTRGNTVFWGSESVRHERFPGSETGIQVRRDRLDGILLDQAARNGAFVMRDVTVRGVSSENQSVTLLFHEHASQRRLQAQWLLDCTGRSGLTAREVRAPEADQETIALIGVWSDTSGLGDIENGTIVESYTDGWAWSIPVTGDHQYVTFMVDRVATDLTRDGAVERMYQGELPKARHMGSLLQGRSLLGRPWACGASAYGAHRYAFDRTLLVGDAGSFIDPLSSFGVKKALASAWVAAAAVHTALKDPSMAPVALDFFDTRERTVYHTFREAAAHQYQAAGPEPHPFWAVRASSDPADRDMGPDIAVLRTDPEVLSAFERLRSAESIDLRLTPDIGRIRAPGIAVDEIVMQDQLSSPWIPSGLRYLRGVNVVALSDLAEHHRQVPDLYEAYNRQHAPVSLPDLLGALAVLLGKGLLRNHAPKASD